MLRENIRLPIGLYDFILPDWYLSEVGKEFTAGVIFIYIINWWLL